jgi:hypothetical protein
MFVQNSTYTWTKMQAAALVALGVYFYWQGWKEKDASRLRVSVALLAAGVLVHYSAAPYALAVALHFAVVGRKSFATRPQEVGIAAGIAVGVIAPWIGWSISAYGVGTTFLENTTANGFRNQSLSQNFGMVFHDIIITIIPGFLRGADVNSWAEAGSWGHIRELAFLTYQANGLLMFGVGGVIALWLVLRRDWSGADPALKIFGLAIVGAGLVGVALHPWPDNYGLAHIALQTLCLIGLGVVAGSWASLRLELRQLVLGGFLVDLLLGVALHVLYESRTFGAGNAGEGGLFSGGERPLPETPWQNWVDKGHHHFIFVGDTFAPYKWLVVLALLAGVWALIRGLLEAGSQPVPSATASPALAGGHLEPAPVAMVAASGQGSVLAVAESNTPGVVPSSDVQPAPETQITTARIGVELEIVREGHVEPLVENEGAPASSKRVLNGQA